MPIRSNVLGIAGLLLIPWTATSAFGQANVDLTPVAPVGIASQTVTPPLPDLETLMAAVQQHQKNDEAVERKYMYLTTTTTETTDKDGKTKHAFTNVDEVYWADGLRMYRPIERMGKPVPADEQRKEEERVRKRAVEQRAKAAAKSKPDQEISLSRLLELGSFTAPRREMVNGRSTIAVDFVGNPKAKTQNDNEKIVHQLAGTVWIDELDHTVQHLQATLLNDFRLAGGMVANIGKGTIFSYSKVRINDEVWLPDTQDIRGHFRLLLVFAANAHIQVRNSDFRKMRVTATILPGTESIPEADTGPDAHPAPVDLPR